MSQLQSKFKVNHFYPHIMFQTSLTERLNLATLCRFHLKCLFQRILWFCFASISGVSNSNWLWGRMRLKEMSRRPRWKKRKKYILNFQLKTKKSMSYILENLILLMFTGRIRPSCGPNAALRPRVWDHCCFPIVCYNILEITEAKFP